MKRYKILCGDVVKDVVAHDKEHAFNKMREYMDAWYDLEDREPPVGWTFNIVAISEAGKNSYIHDPSHRANK